MRDSGTAIGLDDVGHEFLRWKDVKHERHGERVGVSRADPSKQDRGLRWVAGK